MHDLEAIRDACTRVLEEREDKVGALSQYREVVDPESVLELVHMLESGITAHELETLTRMIRSLIDYVEVVPDDANRAVHLDREELLREAKYLHAVYAR